MYVAIAQHSHKIATFAKTIMNTSMKYAISKGKLSDNPALDVSLPKAVKTNAYHTRTIKEKTRLIWSNLQF